LKKHSLYLIKKIGKDALLKYKIIRTNDTKYSRFQQIVTKEMLKEIVIKSHNYGDSDSDSDFDSDFYSDKIDNDNKESFKDGLPSSWKVFDGKKFAKLKLFKVKEK